MLRNFTNSATEFLAHSKNDLMQWQGVRRLSVNICADRFFSQTNGRIATKLEHDGLRVSLHLGCAQGQGQRSRDMRSFLDFWNELLRHWRSGLKFAIEKWCPWPSAEHCSHPCLYSAETKLRLIDYVMCWMLRVVCCFAELTSHACLLL